MKINRGLALITLAFFLFACQPTPPPTVTIFDHGIPITLQTDERVPAAILAQVGITLQRMTVSYPAVFLLRLTRLSNQILSSCKYAAR